MESQHFFSAHPAVMSDPEWIALESLGEGTRHFIFDDAMLDNLQARGLAEPRGGTWQVTCCGKRALTDRVVPSPSGRCS